MHVAHIHIALLHPGKCQRLENLSWSLWFLQFALVQADNAKSKREFKKTRKSHVNKLDKDKNRRVSCSPSALFSLFSSLLTMLLLVLILILLHTYLGLLPNLRLLVLNADSTENVRDVYLIHIFSIC